MNLAFICPPQSPCPPNGYGGAERVANVFVQYLIKFGHKVDLYAGPNSTCPATNLILSTNNNIINGEKELVSKMINSGNKYNCVIDFAACHFASLRMNTPTIALMGGDGYIKYPHTSIRNRIYVSRNYAIDSSFPKHPVIENLISCNPADDYPFGDGLGDYILIYGNINPQKGVHLACRSAIAAGIPIKVAGPIQDYNYWKHWCNFSSNVKYVGVITNHQTRLNLLQNAKALLFPSVFAEGDPLGPKEAMVCGTPVIASNANGMSALIEPFVNGFFAQHENEFATAIWRSFSLDRKLIRKIALEKVDPVPKVRRLEFLCKQVSHGLTW